MLPFLKRNKEAGIAGITIKTRAPDEPSESEDKDDPSAAHESCGRAMLEAIKANDAKGMADAMLDLLEIADKAPDAEPHSYQAQNEEAGEQD